jgi:hypothetical protein
MVKCKIIDSISKDECEKELSNIINHSKWFDWKFNAYMYYDNTFYCYTILYEEDNELDLEKENFLN